MTFAVDAVRGGCSGPLGYSVFTSTVMEVEGTRTGASI